MSGTPSPHELYERTGGGDAYLVAMLEYGHLQPIAPWTLRPPGKRVSMCGVTHDPDWSEWRVYNDAGRTFEGRFCRVCAQTNVREAAELREDRRLTYPPPADSQPEETT